MQKSFPSVDHIAVAVDDLEAAIHWYCEGLNYQLIERRTTRGETTGMISAVIKGNGIPIVLIQGTEPDSQVSRFIEHHGPGVQHMAISVDNLDEAIERLEGLGASPEIATIEAPGIRQVFLEKSASSGVRIELIERRGGDFNDKSIQEMFREFERREAF